jgi:dihydrofolate reductase
MGKLVVRNFSVSLDGFGAGPDQGLKHPLGVNGESLHRWVFKTRTFRKMLGQEGGGTGIDEEFAARGFENIGAWIMGRNMFGPIRGEWPDENWKGWWGEEPPYHVPVFVLTHHARPPLEMKGGTVFHFVTGGPSEALHLAREAAQGKDIRIGGGAATVRSYLQSRSVDEMHLAVSPVLLGTGESLLAGLDLPALGYDCVRHVGTEATTHVVIERTK